MIKGEVQSYMDTLLVETLLAEPKLYKKADLSSSVGQYFSSKIDKENPVSSIFDEFIAPGLMVKLFGWKWGLLMGLLTTVFHIDVAGLLKSLVDKVREAVGDGKKPITQAQLDSAVQDAAQEHSKVAPGEAADGYRALQQRQTSHADDGRVYSSLELLHEAKMTKLAMIAYEHENMRLMKEPIEKRADFFSNFGANKAQKTSLLARIFGWVIRVGLISAGLMVAGDVINLGLGRPSSLSGTYQHGKDEPTAPPAPTSTQTKFKLKGDAPLQSTWPLINTPDNVENMLIGFTKDVYDGLEGKESLIQSSAGFQNVAEKINWYNAHNPGSAVIFLPKVFTTKKQLVDTFIDSVAANAP
jgi:hypothetical protein